MEDMRKRNGIAPADGSKQKRLRAAAEEAEDDGEDIMSMISMEEETVGELMMLLDEAENSRPVVEKVKFIEDPYTSAMIFQSSSSYVTINGNEESCGSSFSESDSSMMVSVDMNGARLKLMEIDYEAVEKWKMWKAEDREEAASIVSDGLSWDEDDLARFIGDEELVI